MLQSIRPTLVKVQTYYEFQIPPQSFAINLLSILDVIDKFYHSAQCCAKIKNTDWLKEVT